MEKNVEKLVKELKEYGLTDQAKMEKVVNIMYDIIIIETSGFYRDTLHTLFDLLLRAYLRVEHKAERTKRADELRSSYKAFCVRYKDCDKCPYGDTKFDCYPLFCYDKGVKGKQ